MTKKATDNVINQKLCFSRKTRRFGVKIGDTLVNKGKQNLIILGALLLLSIGFTVLSPSFLGAYNVTSMSQSLAPYAIMAIGVTFVIATGGIDLSIGTVCIAASVIAGKFYMGGMPLWMTIPMMMLIGLAFGLINGFLIAKLKLPAFIATLGTMMFARGLSALIVSIPSVFYPTGTWFNSAFSNFEGFPIGLVWVIGFMAIAMFVMYKTKVGRYTLAIGSNEEATRLSGINTDKFKIIAYAIAGLFAGIAAIFWSACFPTVAAATGNGMELDAIAGVYIGGTSATGGIASIVGSVIGSALLVVIRSGLNFVLSSFNIQLNATYLTYVLTGMIVVIAVLMDTIKNKNANKVKILTPKETLKKAMKETLSKFENSLDEAISKFTLEKDVDKKAEYKNEVDKLNNEKNAYKEETMEEINKLSIPKT